MQFSGFSVKLIARFKGDVALVEKIEATDDLLCDDGNGGDTICLTTPTGSTRTTTPVYTGCPTTTITPQTTIAPPPPYEEISLDSEEDLESHKDRWQVPESLPKWLEYYTDSETLEGLQNDTESCAPFLAPLFQALDNATGLWSACLDIQDQKLGYENKNVSRYPYVTYFANDQLLHSVTFQFYLLGQALLRLHEDTGDCIDLSVEKDLLSKCKFIPISQNETFWRGYSWSVLSKVSQHQIFLKFS